MPDWRIDVRDFGRVEEASITMAPLVVLVGRNNSGKSYVASLLWSLLSIDDVWLGRSIDVPGWFRDLLAREEPEATPDPGLLEEWLNRLFSHEKRRVVRSLLSYSNASIGDLRISLNHHRSCRFVREEADPEDDDYRLTRGRRPAEGRLAQAVEVRYSIGQGMEEQDRGLVASMLLGEAVNALLFGHLGYPFGRPIYVPAARTGLMLSLPFIVGELLGSLGLEQKSRPSARLPRPTVEFLRDLVNRGSVNDSSITDIATFLERNLLRGSIRRDDPSGSTFSYAPEAGQPMPLHTASSMVSELAPLLLLLRSSPLDRGLVFEEPESHLHLSAQREVARAIARLVHLGVPVVLTTHSDTFVQQLNILIALHGHPDRERLMAQYGYEPEDLIDPGDVRGYEFIETEGGRSRVQAAPMVETGLIVSSLNDVLIELSEEALATQDR